MASKGDKALDVQVHEMLYTNIFMLTYLYPPNKNFWDVFKKDMFVKHNKAAFNQVVYYLLSVLNPTVIEEKISSWPIYDVQCDRQFRSEVTKYLNELNDIYENVKMPLLMTSQLVSPGGFKFAKHLLKLSILVINQHLQNDQNIKMKMLGKPKLQKSKSCVEKQIKRLNTSTENINKETEILRLSFHDKYVTCRNDADNIVEKLNNLHQNMPLLQEKLKCLQFNKVENHKNFVEINNEKVELLKEDLLKVKNNCDKLNKIKDLLIYLSSKDLVLQNTTNSNELDLITLFETFFIELENHCLKMTIFTDLELDYYIMKFSKYIEELFTLRNELIHLHKSLKEASVNIKNTNAELNNEQKKLVPFVKNANTESNNEKKLPILSYNKYNEQKKPAPLIVE